VDYAAAKDFQYKSKYLSIETSMSITIIQKIAKGSVEPLAIL
jgi:hypothetical protein